MRNPDVTLVSLPGLKSFSGSVFRQICLVLLTRLHNHLETLSMTQNTDSTQTSECSSPPSVRKGRRRPSALSIFTLLFHLLQIKTCSWWTSHESEQQQQLGLRAELSLQTRGPTLLRGPASKTTRCQNPNPAPPPSASLVVVLSGLWGRRERSVGRDAEDYNSHERAGVELRHQPIRVHHAFLLCNWNNTSLTRICLRYLNLFNESTDCNEEKYFIKKPAATS